MAAPAPGSDLGPWNIILTADDEVGIIDFGDVACCDAYKDFSGFGDDIVLNAALMAYGADDLLREKTRLRIVAFPILDIPFYLGKGNAKAVQGCLDLVRRLILNGEMSAVAQPAHTPYAR